MNAEIEVEKLLKQILPNTEFAGHIYSAGGFCRDEVLGLESKDLDLVVELVSEKDKPMPEGAKKFAHFLYEKFPNDIHEPFQTGAGYPIWNLKFTNNIILDNVTYYTFGASLDVSDTMKETFSDENSRQRQISWGTLQEDVYRRDFSCNSLLKDMSTGEFLDITYTSISDINGKVIKGNPNVSLDYMFSCDPLRMIRAIRLSLKLDFYIPFSVLKAIKRNSHRISIVSAERIMEELTKIIYLGKFHRAIKMMKVTGLLKVILPEVAAFKGITHSPSHHPEIYLFSHLLLVLKYSPNTIEGQLGALFHDIAKPLTRSVGEDGAIHFYKHEFIGEEMTDKILSRLKFDGKTIAKVKKMVKNHMRPHSLVNASEKAIRSFIRDMDTDLDDVLALSTADEKGSKGVGFSPDQDKLRQRIEAVKTAPVKVNKKPILNGHDIMQVLGIGPEDKHRMKEIGEAIKYLLEVADDYASNGKELDKESAKEELLKWRSK